MLCSARFCLVLRFFFSSRWKFKKDDKRPSVCLFEIISVLYLCISFGDMLPNLDRIYSTKPCVSEIRNASGVAFQIKTTNLIPAMIFTDVFSRVAHSFDAWVECAATSKRTRSFHITSNGIRVPFGMERNSSREEMLTHMRRKCNFHSFFPRPFILSENWNSCTYMSLSLADSFRCFELWSVYSPIERASYSYQSIIIMWRTSLRHHVK